MKSYSINLCNSGRNTSEIKFKNYFTLNDCFAPYYYIVKRFISTYNQQ